MTEQQIPEGFRADKNGKLIPIHDQIPAGFRENSRGVLVPESQIAPLDIVRDDVMRSIRDRTHAMRREMLDYKVWVLGELAALAQLSAEKYAVKLKRSDEQDSLTVPMYDGSFKLVTTSADIKNFDQRIAAAEQLLTECINEFTDGTNDYVKQLLAAAFRRNGKGQITMTRAYDLMRSNINHPKWQLGIQALKDALQPVGRRNYLRLYERDERGNYNQIQLDISTI